MKNGKHSMARTVRSGGITCLLGLLLFAVAFAPGNSRAQSEIPELTVKENGQAKKLELREFSIEVHLEGVLVETILELEFFNHTTRRQEGEFSLQLPEGATVSTYALDINGKMRPGVSVEKEKARHAYETIKRKMIDPGLVERQAGNIYRTRIFPIEPNRPKRVRIGYIRNLVAALKDPLPPDALTIPFEFEFKNAQKLKLFQCRVTGAAAPPILKLPNVPGSQSNQEGEFTWKAENIAFDGILKAQSTLPGADQPMVRQDEATGRGHSHFVVQGRLPEIKPDALDKPNKFSLIWDASLSGRGRDHEPEIAALIRYVKWLGNVTVSFRTLRDQLGPLQRLVIRDGKVEELEALLRGISYDGGADFSKIEESPSLTLLVTDGEKTSPAWNISDKFTSHNLYLVTSARQAVDPRLIASAAAHVDLQQDNWWDVLTRKIPALVVEGLPKSEWSASRVGGFFTVTGRLEKDWDRPAVIRRNGSAVTVMPVPKAERLKSRDEWTFTRRIWAQQQLRSLEDAGDPRKIAEFAKSERLVSDHTSLIVLERFEDHLTYRIPPPEPELLARYELALEEHLDVARQNAIQAWKKKLTWHGTDFPWMDSQLMQETSAVAIWVKASRAVFSEDELNTEMIETFESWLPKAQTTIHRKNTLKDQNEFVGWKSEVGRRIAELKKLREQRKAPEVDQPVHVSVRGFVKSRGVISDNAPATLNQAIELAGGPFMVPLSRVYLYRDALRTGYNMESAQYRPVPLFDGDMIVVEADVEESLGAAGGGAPDRFMAPDPFAAPPAGGGGASSARSASPVFEETGTARGSAIPMVSPNPAGFVPDGKIERKLQVSLVPRKPKPLATEVDEAVLETLRNHADPAAFYQELTEGLFLESAPSAATIIEIARFFFEKANTELGNRVLSNLVEIQSNKFEASRSMAYWLADFNGHNAPLMEELVRTAPDDGSKAIASYDIAQIFAQNNFDPAAAPNGARQSSDWYSNTVTHELKTGAPGALSTIALTDHFRRTGQPAGTIGRGDLTGFLADPMTSDVRIVVTSCGDQVDLFVTEPESKTATGPVGASVHGGRIDQSHRVQEYQVRFGMPGTYQLKCRRAGFGIPFGAKDAFHEKIQRDLEEADLQPITIQVAYYTNWGRAGEEMRVRTYLMENLELELDGLEFGWSE